MTNPTCLFGESIVGKAHKTKGLIRPGDTTIKILARRFLIFLLLLCPLGLAADTESSANVMLFGVFHFANPGKDVVKFKEVDVMTPENQAYLEGLAKRIADFKPTVVLLEFDLENEARMQEKYRQFLVGANELGRNEIYQLGFRIAKQAGVKTIYSFDDREVSWQAAQLFDYMPIHDPETKARLDALIGEITKAKDVAHASKSLAELLMQSNDPEKDNLN